jgi:hypothetical protein
LSVFNSAENLLFSPVCTIPFNKIVQTNFPNEDGNLLKLIADGDETAFRQLYDLYAGKIYTLAVTYLKSPLLAQDIVQEVFIKVWEKRTQLYEVKNFPACDGPQPAHRSITEKATGIQRKQLDRQYAEGRPTSATAATGLQGTGNIDTKGGRTTAFPPATGLSP